MDNKPKFEDVMNAVIEPYEERWKRIEALFDELLEDVVALRKYYQAKAAQEEESDGEQKSNVDSVVERSGAVAR